jgi:hypothetical protein
MPPPTTLATPYASHHTARSSDPTHSSRTVHLWRRPRISSSTCHGVRLSTVVVGQCGAHGLHTIPQEARATCSQLLGPGLHDLVLCRGISMGPHTSSTVPACTPYTTYHPRDLALVVPVSAHVHLR